MVVTNFSLSIVVDWDSIGQNKVVDRVVKLLLYNKVLNNLNTINNFVVFNLVLLISQDLNIE